MKRFYYFFVLGIALLSLNDAWSLTAFQAKEVAEKQLGEGTKNKLISMEGPRSANSLTPTEWRFVFFDPHAEQQGKLIRVRDKSVAEMREGYFELKKLRLASYKPEEIIDSKELKIDSNKALDIVNKAADIKNTKLSTVTFKLSKSDDGTPLWRMEFLADKEGYETDIGWATVHVGTGQIVEMKIDASKIAKKK